MPTSKRSDPIPPNVWFYPEAEQDFLLLDRSRQILVLKAIWKIARAPAQFGKPLANQEGRPLAGFRSVYVDGKSIRIVWTVASDGTAHIAVIADVAEREGFQVYETAARRRVQLREWIERKLSGEES